MSDLNVLKQIYSPWRYPSNWIKNCRLFFRRYKWAYQRVTKGFADCDVWDLDVYYLHLFYATLNHLADITHGYPGTTEFPTPEVWDKYLRDMAMDFYKANESNDYYEHPAQDVWWEEVKDIDEPWNHQSAASKEMCNESVNIMRKQNKDMENGLDKMKHVFWHLWD